MIESTGSIGLYHEGFSYVSRKASADYLDRVFVDMMWCGLRSTISAWRTLNTYTCVLQQVQGV